MTAAPRAARGLLEALGGGPAFLGDQACWRVETPVECGSAADSDFERFDAPVIRIAPRAGADPLELAPRRLLIADIETGGFAGTPVFLIGVLHGLPDGPRIEQWLTRDFPDEPCVIRAFAGVAVSEPVWISFNGRSFDEPFLRDRAVVHRIALPPPALHIDVLHAARRRWKGTLPNFRLATLERALLGDSRSGDVSGADVPDLFHHFFRTGNAAPLACVLEHNRRDLLTTARLLARLLD